MSQSLENHLYSGVTMGHVTVPGNSSSSLNSTRNHHITSSPHHPQSNGFAEALVGILKKLIKKSIKDGKLWNYGLIQNRVTPISSTIPSPLEILTGRKLRSSLPQIPSPIGKSVESSRICQELLKHQPSTSTRYSMELKPGQLFQ